jgi:hypothetical protein
MINLLTMTFETWFKVRVEASRHFRRHLHSHSQQKFRLSTSDNSQSTIIIAVMLPSKIVSAQKQLPFIS